MIKLYGLKMSNYYSLTKALLIEKDLAFEEIKAPPSQSEDYLARSPMGKMPSIEVDGQFLSESIAIFNYLEQLLKVVKDGDRLRQKLTIDFNGGHLSHRGTGKVILGLRGRRLNLLKC